MPDGINIPNITIPNIDNNQDVTPRSYQSSAPLGNEVYFSPTSYNVSPALYDIDKVALQSGLTNWANSFIQGLNQTQISTNQFSLFQNQKRIAELEGGNTYQGELQKLDSAHLAKEIDDVEYLQSKSAVLDELNELYRKNTEIQNSIFEDEIDITKAPVSKAFQTRQTLLQGLGAEAGFLDQVTYNLPSVAGSSAATLGATVIAGFGANYIKKLATRIAASTISGPAAPVVSAGATIMTLGSLLYYARDLESQAEVGGAIAEDLERLTQDYLSSTGKTEGELTPEEHNDLITKAYSGSERQYWKNMALAGVDALQSMLLAGNVGKWFERIANLNKVTRVGARLGEFYVQSKAEGLEEGLQYAFQKEKNSAANNPNYLGNESAYFDGLSGFLSTVGNKDFINSLRSDYADVLASMSYGPIKGNGKYSEDPEFQFSTDAGFLMGLATGGGAALIRTAKDITNYKKAASELEKAGLENASGNAFKFSTGLYESFFTPSAGLFGSSAGDRVHYLREGIKALGKKKDSNGEPILTQEEVQLELRNIGEAYRTYDSLSQYVNDIFPPFGKDNSKMAKVAKSAFNHAIFTEAMQGVYNKKRTQEALDKHSAALLNVDPEYAEVVDIMSSLEAIKARKTQINNLTVGEDIRAEKLAFLESEERELFKQLQISREALKDAGNLSKIPPIPPQLTTANAEFLTSQMFEDESKNKYDKLLKVKTFKQLIDWFKESAAKQALEGLTESSTTVQNLLREEYAEKLANRRQYDLLTIEEERERQKENKKILSDVGFTEAEINSLGYEALEARANEILNSFVSTGTYINENLQYRTLSAVKTKQQFQSLFDVPTTSQFLTRTFPGVTRDSDFAPLVKQAKDFLSSQTKVAVKKPLKNVPTGTYTSIGRNRMPGDVRTLSDLSRELRIPDNNGEVDQIFLLNNIINSSYSTPTEKALARELLKVSEQDDVVVFSDLDVAGLYNIDDNLVSIDLRHVVSDYENNNAPFETVVLHELLHKYTISSLESNPDSELNSRLKNLYNFVSDQARTKNVFDKFYGFKNPYEFITEAMTNPEFQAFLKSITYTIQKRTAWEEFLNLVNQALRALGVTTNQTALDEIVAVTSEAVGLANRESFSSIRTRVEEQIDTQINSKKTIKENENSAKELYKNLYDLNLSKAEFDILKSLIDERLAEINSNKKAEDQFKFGKWLLEKGNFVVPTGKNYIYTVVSQNKDGSLIVSYEFLKDTKKQTGSRTINSPEEISEIFTDKNAAFNYIKGRPVVKSTETKPTSSDSFGDALDNFVNYKREAYGSIDPKLLELGSALIKEAIKIGKTNFYSISSEIIVRVGEDKFKEIFNNLRQVYSALFADYKSQLTDNEGDILNLVMGRTTAESMLNLLRQIIETGVNTYTGGTATDEDEINLANKNARDKVSGELYKSIGQQFKVDENNKWTGELDDDPVKVRYYNFIDWALRQTKSLDSLGFYGLLVQDGESLPNGLPIPKERSTLKYIEKQKAQGKPITYGQIGIITDKAGIPLRFNQQGELNEDGDFITFNIESVKTASEKSPAIVSKVNSITEAQASASILKASKNVEAIRNSAKSGKPILLKLKPKAGVPIFGKEKTSTNTLVGKNIEIEIPNLSKDSSNIGYFERHPNQTGFLGGAYIFLNGQPVKIEPNPINEETSDLIIAILDEQIISKIGEEEVKARSKFLQELIYQKFDKTNTQGTFYVSGSDLYVNGAKVPKADRKTALLNSGRFNIVSYLLNNNWRPYILRDGKIIKGKNINYNSFVLTNSSTLAKINTDGKQVVANSYLTYTVENQVIDWLRPVVKSEPSPSLASDFKAKTLESGRIIPIDTVINELDLDANIGGLEDFIRSSEEVKLLQLTIDENGNRTGVIYIDRGESPSGGSTKQKVIFKPISPSESSTEVVELPEKPSQQKSKKDLLIEKLRKENLKDLSDIKQIDNNLKKDMDSLANPRTFSYGSIESAIPNLGVTTSLVAVKSIDRLIYDFIKSYDKSIVETLNEPKILTAAYKFAYSAFKNNLVDLRNQYISKIEKASDENIESILDELNSKTSKFESVIKGWNDVVEYHKQHSKTFIIKDDTIRFSFDESGNIIEENDDSDLERAKNSFEGLSGNEISSVDGANKETKALVRGLGKAKYTGGKIQPVYNEFGIQELVDFGSTWNNLAMTLQGTMEFEHMLSKIESMIPAFPEYQELLEIIASPANDIDKISQIAKFRQDFSRSYIGVYELVFDPITGSYKFLESTKNNIESIKDQYSDNFINFSTGKYISRDEFGNNYLTPDILEFKLDSIQDRISFLGQLGIVLSEASFKDPQFNDVISGRTITAIKNSLSTLIKNGVKVTNPVQQISQPNSNLKLKGEAGNINKILRLESKYNRNNATASMRNAAGDTVYALSLNNLLTVSNNYLSDFTNYPTYQDVVALPHMKHLDFRNNPYVKNSIWLNEMFHLDETQPNFGERKIIGGQPVVLTLINYNGLKVEREQGSSEGSTTTSLWIGDKLVQDFNSLLIAGTKEMMRAGDKSSAFAVRINGYTQNEGKEDKLPVKLDEFSSGYGGIKALEIFSGYLVDEVVRMSRVQNGIGENLDYYKNSGASWNLFREILSDKTKADILADVDSDLSAEDVVAKHRKALATDLRTFFAAEVESKKNSFSGYNFSLSDISWVDKALRDSYDFSQLLRAYVVNSFIINVEQTKLFNGDGAFYKAFHKRNSKDTSTGTTMMTDQYFIDWLNNDPNTNLQSKLLGVNNEVTNITNTVVFEDNNVASVYVDIYRQQLTELGLPSKTVESIVEKYEDANEGDAQGWITLDFYRTFKLAQGKWYPEHETIYSRISRGETVTQEEMFYFMPIKAQYAGPLDYTGVFAPAFHKFSLVPLIPSLVKGTKLEALNEKMIRNNVGYGLFESGSKVATILNESGQKDKFYSDYIERTPVDPSTPFTALNPVFNHYLKEQVNIEPDLHEEVIFGTQFRKLLFQNVFNEGKAIDERWQALYDEYSYVIDRLVFNEKQRLLEELGIEQIEPGIYKNVDVSKLIEKFTKEARRRGMNDNVVSFMEVEDLAGTFKYPLDASINRQQIQNMIMSIINNRLVRQHTSGDLMVQVSGAGFEKYQKPTDEQLSEYGTNGLRFYHLKDGKTQSMQVKVPLNGDFINLLYYTHPDGQRIETLSRLNEALKDASWVEDNRKSITMIGYRIPTQGLNSMEFMEIAEFLPSESGNILILPTEIVIKAGSDYDIDKLSIFKPSIRVKYRSDNETRTKIVEKAFYTDTNYIDLTKSIEAQKQELKESYEESITILKDKTNKIRDEKILDTRWYFEQKNKLKEQFGKDIESVAEKLIDIEHNIRDVQLQIAFKRDDVERFKLETSVEGFDAETADQLFVLEGELSELYIDLELLYDDRNQLRNQKRGTFGTRRALLDEAQRVINNYLDNYYAELYDPQNDLNEVLTDYFNRLEELRSFKKGLQNRLISIGREVLEDKSNFVQLITPNDTGLIKQRIVKEGGIKQRNGYPLKTDYTGTSIYTEKTQEEKFLAGLVGKKALGIAAVNNTFTQLFEIIGLKVNKNYTEAVGDNTIRHTIYMRLLEKLNADSFDFSRALDEDGVLKSEFISQMINAYVDVLNDDFIFYANAGLDIAPIIFYLKNAGVGTEKIFNFINHPVIKYYINGLQVTKSFVLKAINPEQYDNSYAVANQLPTYKNRFIKALLNYSPNTKSENVTKGNNDAADKNPGYFDSNRLLSRISDPITSIGYDERRAVLGYFLQVQNQANMLRKFQAANSYDTSTAATPITSQNFDKLKNEVLDSGFIDSKYQEAISNTVIKPFNVTDVVSSMFNNLMPITLGDDIIKFLLERSEYVSIENRDKFARLFTNDILLYVFENYVKLPIEGNPSAYEYIFGGGNYNSMFTFTNAIRDGKNVKIDGRLAKRIRDVKNSKALIPLRTQYPILNQLRVITTDRPDGFANITIYRGEDTADTQNSLIEQFKALVNFNDPAYNEVQRTFIRKLFNDLALFGFAQSGLNKSPISYTDIIPNELYTPLITEGINAFKADIQARGFSDVMWGYFNKFKQNNPELEGRRSELPSYKFKNYKTTIVRPQNTEITSVEQNEDFTPSAEESLPLNETKSRQEPRSFEYGNLAIQPESRILDSRNSVENQEVNDILQQFTEQSKPCNS